MLLKSIMVYKFHC